MLVTIEPSAIFKENLDRLPPIDDVERVDLVDATGAVVAVIENKPGQQGSLAVHQYLKQIFGRLDVEAADHALLIFGEHTIDARNRPGVHPNVDRILAIAEGGSPLGIEVVVTKG